MANDAVDVIVGAGPAGLTAAYELLEAGHPPPIVIESGSQVGGISKTINYRGNRMDLGGHRFFSKSDWVMNWWQNILPIDAAAASNLTLAYQNSSRDLEVRRGAGSEQHARMLVRSRLSRIYYQRKFYEYPIKLNGNTVRNLGVARMARIAASYAAARMSPRTPERSLEDFIVNRFGEELYRTFFRDYTEKVWGVPCAQISAEWGAQRIKGLSIWKALTHALGSALKLPATRRRIETSLIEQFLYPRLGPGQLWEEVARRIVARGAQIRLGMKVVGVHHDGRRVARVDVLDMRTRELTTLKVRHFVSTMPIRDLAAAFAPAAPHAVAAVARDIPYRDFMTVGLLVDRMTPRRDTRVASASANGMPPDNWIYVQEPDVKLGRLQIFNNWSPAMVSDPSKIWLGLEYFCKEGDEAWSMADPAFADFAARELEKIGLIARNDVRDATVVRVPKAYPAYFGAYAQFETVKDYFDAFENVYLVGRNGMHRYNNQDHSMLAAKAAVEAIGSGTRDKSPIWDVNTEDDYHEEASTQPVRTKAAAVPGRLSQPVEA